MAGSPVCSNGGSHICRISGLVCRTGSIPTIMTGIVVLYVLYVGLVAVLYV